MLSMLLTRADFEHVLVTTTPNPSTTYGYYHGNIIFTFIFKLLY